MPTCPFIRQLSRNALIAALLLIAIALAAPAAAATAGPDGANADESADASAIRVLIFPFDIHSSEDLDFLRSGIQDMLATRLSAPGRTRPLSREETAALLADISGVPDEETARRIGSRAGVDFIVTGSLTVLGESISTDVRFINPETGQAPVVFHETGKSQGDVIGHVDAFARQVNAEVFGEKPAPAQPPAPKTPESRRNPEDVWREERGITSDDLPEAGEERRGGAVFGDAESRRALPREDIWRSRDFKAEVVGLSVGDVDGDGAAETVFVSEDGVFIQRYMDGAFARLAEIDTDRTTSLIGVDVADINGNGRAEIFVTGVNRNAGMTRSFVLEYDGARFKEITSGSDWYFRVLKTPGRPDLLLGQRRGAGRLFVGGVHALQFNGSEYTPAGEQPLPAWANVFSFTRGDILNDGRDLIAALTEADRLRLLDGAGAEIWTSEETYGGSLTHLNKAMANTTAMKGLKPEERHYISQRLIVADTDGDGAGELITIKNKDQARRVFSNLRLFKGGRIISLAWDKLGMYENWTTREVDGYISDMAIADADNDGQMELVFAVVTKRDSVISNSRSFIAFQSLPSGKE